MANGNSKTYNPDWCNERHEQIDRRFQEMDTRLTGWMEKIDRRLWAGLVLIMVQACAFIGLLLKIIIE